MVRAKFVCHRIEQPDQGESGKELRTVVLYPVYGDGETENAEFWRYTPSGEVRLGTVNEAAWGQFVVGQEYYIDFTPAPVQS